MGGGCEGQAQVKDGAAGRAAHVVAADLRLQARRQLELDREVRSIEQAVQSQSILQPYFSASAVF